MKTLRSAASLRGLRDQPLWNLLSSHKAPVVIALLQSLFLEDEKSIPSSVLHERATRELEALRASGEDLPQSAQAYIADWLSSGWLNRRFPAGAQEEEYDLSTEAQSAVRFIMGALKPRVTTTESRLSLVIQQLSRLAEETDANAASRVQALRAERDRIDCAIAEIERVGVKVLAADRALERTREVISLAQELTADFRKVRSQFDRLNRGLRQSLMENEGSRGDVLESLFHGVDLIGESDAGRTFHAFWRLLTDGEQAGTLVDALDAIVGRDFARELDPPERKFLLSLTATLLDEGSGVHDVLQNFARSLKSFVQSREFLEQRRLHGLLKTATVAALGLKDLVRTTRGLDYPLMLTSSRIRSVSQWTLFDPAQRMTDSSMPTAEPSDMTLDALADLVRQSEIDFRTLRQHIRALLERQSQASIGEVLEVFPAEQGLGSVVGYLWLGDKHGEVTPGKELVSWRSADDVERRARVPAIYFMREKYHELAD